MPARAALSEFFGIFFTLTAPFSSRNRRRQTALHDGRARHAVPIGVDHDRHGDLREDGRRGRRGRLNQPAAEAASGGHHGGKLHRVAITVWRKPGVVEKAKDKRVLGSAVVASRRDLLSGAMSDRWPPSASTPAVSKLNAGQIALAHGCARRRLVQRRRGDGHEGHPRRVARRRHPRVDRGQGLAQGRPHRRNGRAARARHAGGARDAGNLGGLRIDQVVLMTDERIRSRTQSDP